MKLIKFTRKEINRREGGAGVMKSVGRMNFEKRKDPQKSEVRKPSATNYI